MIQRKPLYYKQMPVSIDLVPACSKMNIQYTFASKALTEAQQGYIAIELESLAVAWAIEEVPPLSVWKSIHT